MSVNNTGLGVEFNLDLEDGFISERGEDVIAETAILCPVCNQPSFNGGALSEQVYCDNCEGVGYIWRNPRTITVVITSMRQNKQLWEQGFAEPGDAILSLSPYLDPPLGNFDKITFLSPQVVNEGEVIARGKRENPYQQKLLANEDLLAYSAYNAIYCEDKNGKVYYDDSDFTLKGRVIQWTTEIPEGMRYVIKYNGYLEWIVFSPAMERRDHGISLGQRLLVRKKHLTNLLKKDFKETTIEKVDSLSGSITV